MESKIHQYATPMTATAKLQLLTTILLFGFILAIFYHGIITYLSLGFPYDTFLFKPWDRFKDFLVIYDMSKDLNPYANYTNYFPLAYLLFYPFTWITNQNASLIIFLDLFCCFMFCNTHYYLKNCSADMPKTEYLKNITILCLLSYPTLFCLDRANIDTLLFIFVALFIIAFIKRFYLLSAFLLAIAIGMKGFPAIFIILLLKQKKYVAAGMCLVFTVLLSLLALVSFKSGITSHHFLEISHALSKNYLINDGALTASISLFSLAKVLLKYFYMLTADGLVTETYHAAIATMLPYYTAATAIILILVTYYILAIEKVLWKQVMLLVAMLALLPVMSGDYRLIFFYIPLLLFMVHADHDKLDYCYTILFGLLFIPKNFFTLPHTETYAFTCVPMGLCSPIPTSNYSVMSLLNVMLLLSFMGLIIFTGMKKKNRSPYERSDLRGTLRAAHPPKIT